jgi:hypothetical protein
VRLQDDYLSLIFGRVGGNFTIFGTSYPKCHWGLFPTPYLPEYSLRDHVDVIHDFYHSGLALGDLAQADISWWEQALASGLREQVQPRDFCTLGVAWGDGSGSGGTFEWVDSGKGALPSMEAWMEQ